MNKQYLLIINLMSTNASIAQRFNPKKLILKISSDLKNARTSRRIVCNVQYKKKSQNKTRKKSNETLNNPTDCLTQSSNKATMVKCGNKSQLHINKNTKNKLKLNYLFAGVTFDNNINQNNMKDLNEEIINPNEYSFESPNMKTSVTKNITIKKSSLSKQRSDEDNYSFSREDSSYNYSPFNRDILQVIRLNHKSKMVPQRSSTYPGYTVNDGKILNCFRVNTSDRYKSRNTPIMLRSISNQRTDENIRSFRMPCNKKIVSIDAYSRNGYENLKVKTNQEFYCIINNYLREYEENDSFFTSICDGHGEYGHLVSNYVINRLPNVLKFHLGKNSNIIKNFFKRDIAILKAFKEMNETLIKTEIDTTQSGTSCCSLIITPFSIICCNIGDSRAVIGRYLNNKWSSVNLSRDHKPEVPKEKLRILTKGGRIRANYNTKERKTFEPLRIWKYNENIPGLALTRSFGDTIGASIGIISEPEIKEYHLTTYDKFLIVASDGVWKYISSHECINMINPFYLNNDIKSALEFVYKASEERWLKNNNNTIDDITLIIGFFE